MEGGTESGAALTHVDIGENATIVEEGIKLCPLCRAEVRPYFINFNEKVLLCDRSECDYPFGYDELTFLKEDEELPPDEELPCLRDKTVHSSQATYSMISSQAWSEIDKIQKKCDTEDPVDVRSEAKVYFTCKQSKVNVKKKVDDNKKILKQLETIKKLNVELIGQAEKTPIPSIKNKKWIKNLMDLQKNSGVALLKPEEMKLLNKKQPEIGLGELKIDIDVGRSNDMSSIKIAIGNAQTNKNND